MYWGLEISENRDNTKRIPSYEVKNGYSRIHLATFKMLCCNCFIIIFSFSHLHGFLNV